MGLVDQVMEESKNMLAQFEDLKEKMFNSCLLPHIRQCRHRSMERRLEGIKDKLLREFLFLDDEDIALLSTKKFRTIHHLEQLSLHELELIRGAKEIEASTYLSLRFYVMWNTVHQPHYTDIESMTQNDFFDLDRKAIEDAFLQKSSDKPSIESPFDEITISTVQSNHDDIESRQDHEINNTLHIVKPLIDHPLDKMTGSTMHANHDKDHKNNKTSDTVQKTLDSPFVEMTIGDINSNHDNIETQKAADNIDVNWDSFGKEVGTKIWRIEDKHENGVTRILPWTERLYGQFFAGENYIILSTAQAKSDNEEDSLLFDIYIWVGSESTKDEYDAIVYKICELDGLLGNNAILHREVQHYESNTFLNLFTGKRVHYLIKGIRERFEDSKCLPTRLYHIRRTNRQTRCVEVPLKCESLNQGDAFVLDAGDVVYTWFGTLASSFEKSEAAALSHNLSHSVTRLSTRQVSDVEDDDEEFWNFLGGKGEIMEADDIRITEGATEVPTIQKQNPVMFTFSNDTKDLKIESVSTDKESLDRNSVSIIDIGSTVFIWIGGSSAKERHAMCMAQAYLNGIDEGGTKSVIRILEGQEGRAHGWPL